MLTRLGRAPRPTTTLVGLLLDCHARIRQFLGVARAVAEREDVTPADRVEACERVERYFRVALPLHVADEEDGVAPRLSAAPPEVRTALAAMVRQHGEHEPALDRLLSSVARLRAAPGDASARVELAEAVAALAPELEAHLSLEEEVIFPYLEQTLTPALDSELVAELRARRAPSAPSQ